jgi:hypothetical protein
MNIEKRCAKRARSRFQVPSSRFSDSGIEISNFELQRDSCGSFLIPLGFGT